LGQNKLVLHSCAHYSWLLVYFLLASYQPRGTLNLDLSTLYQPGGTGCMSADLYVNFPFSSTVVFIFSPLFLFATWLYVNFPSKSYPTLAPGFRAALIKDGDCGLTSWWSPSLLSLQVRLRPPNILAFFCELIDAYVIWIVLFT